MLFWKSYCATCSAVLCGLPFGHSFGQVSVNELKGMVKELNKRPDHGHLREDVELLKGSLELFRGKEELLSSQVDALKSEVSYFKACELY